MDVETLKIEFRKLTDDERYKIMSDYCHYCGRFDGDDNRGCQCWNDE
jgi:hypothetical protein